LPNVDDQDRGKTRQARRLKSMVDSVTADDIFPAMTIGLWIARRRTR
jgi:hypothetical protein